MDLFRGNAGIAQCVGSALRERECENCLVCELSSRRSSLSGVTVRIDRQYLSASSVSANPRASPGRIKLFAYFRQENSIRPLRNLKEEFLSTVSTLHHLTDDIEGNPG